MKRTVSINIGGSVFHLEDDGYERLKSYLASIHRYFATYDDSAEIIADIESRMAELFYQRLTPTSQVLTAADVEGLIAKMGSVADFQQMEEVYFEGDVPPAGGTTAGAFAAGARASGAHDAGATAASTAGDATGSRRLFRDLNYKLIGGVASGLAHYFRVDPLWMRVLFLLPPFLDWVILPGSITSLTVLAYIVLWIAVPGRTDLNEDERIKKLYRNPDSRVLGGVSSGLAAYFGTDVVVVRVLFLLLIFLGGFGVLLYLVLWAITPEAKTLTEKMRMRGEPVTLSNIEARVKESFRTTQPGEESAVAKVLLFPFRVIALVVRSVSASGILEFAGTVLRIGAGLLLLFIAFVLALATVAVMGAGLGAWSADTFWINGEGVPLTLFRDDFPLWALIPAAFALLLPTVALGLAGLSLLARRTLMGTLLGLTLFGLWLLSLVALAVAVPNYAARFRTEAAVDLSDTFPLRAEVITLAAGNGGEPFFNERTRLYLRGYAGETPRLEKRFTARGRSRQDAIEQAGLMRYQVSRRDSTLVFDRGFMLDPTARFRVQELEVTLQLPYGQKFRVEPDLAPMVRSSASQIGRGTWVFTADGLTCLDCPDNERADGRPDRGDRDEEATRRTRGASGSYERTFAFEDFSRLRVNDAFQLQVRRGDRYRVVVSSDRADDLEHLQISQSHDELEISFDRDDHWVDRLLGSDPLRVEVELPDLSALRLGGAVEADVAGFESDDLAVDLEGAAHVRMDVDAGTLKAELSGASELTLTGNGTDLTADLSGAARLHAYEYVATHVEVEASGAARAQVHATDQLRADANGAATVRYRGQPGRLEAKDSGAGSVKSE